MATEQQQQQQQQGYRWQVPQQDASLAEKHQLKLLNSYTKRKELFVPNNGRTIKWYSCGPTVYDVAHLGHARSYMTFDIMRRILADYFGFHVLYVMNITDIDDKIIKRARSNHLCDKFIREQSSKLDQSELLEFLNTALASYKSKRADEKDPAKLDMINNLVSSSSQAIKDIEQLVKSDGYQDKLGPILERLRDVIADYEDDKLGHAEIEHEIFKSLASKYEQEFHSDMQKLNVLRPSTLTRVSEFIDEIGAYIQKIELNGYAYRSGGSVYFDTLKFDTDPKHSYAKLVREAYGHKKSLDEGEGELSVVAKDKKKSPGDFALWKKSKSGEPSWTTQDLEPGRPGWHIECSAMASLVLGENFDLHSGGCDLKFPHHDNEIAQAEAYYNTGRNWVNYFVHSGHLSISGCKMSKSLKNFITIRQALNEFTARQLRFAFLAHGWAETLDYSPNTMNTATSYEKTFREFFLNVADYLRRSNGDVYRKWSKDDHELNEEFLLAIDKVDMALCDNLDTRTALNAMSALIKECNKRPDANSTLVSDISNYIKRILRIFGAEFEEVVPTEGGDSEAIFKFVDTLAQFRSDVRRISKAGEAPQGFYQILALCDSLRDKILPDLGVRLEDRDKDSSYVVKIMDPESLARERAAAEEKKKEKSSRKNARRNG